jgi:hypothetical protein
LGVCLLALAVGAGTRAVADAPAAAAGRIGLRNDRVTVVLGRAERGAIVSLADNASGAEFIAAQAAPRLFGLVLSRTDGPGADRITLSSGDARNFSAREGPGCVTSLRRLGECRSTCLHGTEGAGRPAVRWGLAVRVPTAGPRRGAIPVVALRLPLGPDGKDDAAVIGHTRRRPPNPAPDAGRTPLRPAAGSLARVGCYYDAQAVLHRGLEARGSRRTSSWAHGRGLEAVWNPHVFAQGEWTWDTRSS